MATPLVTVPAHDVQVYSWGFETFDGTYVPDSPVYTNDGSDATGWTTSYVANGSGATSATIESTTSGGSAPPRLLLRAVGSLAVNPTPSARAERLITGLTVGRRYEFSARIQSTSGCRARITFGTGVSAWQAVAAERAVSGSFIATATTATLALEVEDNPSSTVAQNSAVMWADDIRITRPSFDGEEGLDGWNLTYGRAEWGAGGDDVRVGGRTGTYALWNQNGATRVFTDLIPGHDYTIAFWFKHTDGGGGYGQVEVVETGDAAYFDSAPAGEWVQWSLTFTATAASHTVELMAYHGLTDDITLVHHVPASESGPPALTIDEALYGDRNTTYRWEVLSHADGVDHLVGVLDGVVDATANLWWALNAAVKGGGRLRVADLETARDGLMRIGELDLESVRLRPVCVIEGLPEIPLSVFLVAAAREDWSATGRVWALELLDRCTVPDQDKTEESFALPAGTVILTAVRDVLASAGEHIDVDGSVTAALAAPMVWPAGTSKLQIVNDLLAAAGFSALWVDAVGAFRATPYVVPAQRSIAYEVLGLPRELVDGERSIYEPRWQRDRDAYSVPNKVVAIQGATGEDEEAIVGVWTNEDPTSPFSYQVRGRWITSVLEGVDVPDGTPAEIEAFLEGKARQSLIAASAVQAQVQVRHLPVPLRVSEVLRFASAPAGIDARHVVTRIELEAHPRGLMRSELEEVVDL